MSVLADPLITGLLAMVNCEKTTTWAMLSWMAVSVSVAVFKVAKIVKVPSRSADYLIIALPKLAALPPRDLPREVFRAINESELADASRNN